MLKFIFCFAIILLAQMGITNELGYSGELWQTEFFFQRLTDVQTKTFLSVLFIVGFFLSVHYSRKSIRMMG